MRRHTRAYNVGTGISCVTDTRVHILYARACMKYIYTYIYIYIYIYTYIYIYIYIYMYIYAYQGFHSNHAQTARFNRPTFLLCCQTMSSQSIVGLAGAPSTLIHKFQTIRTIPHPSHMHRPRPAAVSLGSARCRPSGLAGLWQIDC